jgi:hypothetical protein
LAGATLLAGLAGQRTSNAQATGKAASDEEYVWLSANANLPLFVAHDHPALKIAGHHAFVRKLWPFRV